MTKRSGRVTLNPLRFDEVVAAILKVKPEPKPPKKRPKAKKRGKAKA